MASMDYSGRIRRAMSAIKEAGGQDRSPRGRPNESSKPIEPIEPIEPIAPAARIVVEAMGEPEDREPIERILHERAAALLGMTEEAMTLLMSQDVDNPIESDEELLEVLEALEHLQGQNPQQLLMREHVEQILAELRDRKEQLQMTRSMSG